MAKLFALLRAGFSLIREQINAIRTYDEAVLRLREERRQMAITRRKILNEMVCLSVPSIPPFLSSHSFFFMSDWFEERCPRPFRQRRNGYRESRPAVE
jgi:hypothetical protein